MILKISPTVLKQSKSNVYSQTSFCGFHSETPLSGLWENVELTEIIKCVLTKMVPEGM